MPRRDVTVPATLLLKEGVFMLPTLKMDSLKFSHDNIDQVYNKTFTSSISRDEKTAVKTQLKLEMVVTAIHHAEILASYLLAFEKKGKTIQRSLFSYNTKDVNDFYKEIKTKGNPYIAKVFSYPQLHQLHPEELRNKFKKSLFKIKKDLKEIGEYYLHNLDLYNSYKHGLRVAYLSAQAEDSEDAQGIIAYFIPDKSFYPAKATMVRIDYKKAQKLVVKMTTMLYIATTTYHERIIEKKDQFTTQLY